MTGKGVRRSDLFWTLYFDWMTRLVCKNHPLGQKSWRKLFDYLYRTEFTYILDLDENRACDGIELRYRFGYEHSYSGEEIQLAQKPCSIFEMMVALAVRCEENIMADPAYGDRTGEWFFGMIKSLGLDQMSDDCFDRDYVKAVVSHFLDRTYEPDGRGGLFTVNDPRIDMRKTEIWYQMMRYLNELP